MAAVIFKRTKSKPTQRLRPTSSELAVESGEGADVSPITLASKLKKSDRQKSKLSFGTYDEDGDGEVFEVKKSNLSRKLASGKKVLPSLLDPASMPQRSNTGPTYDKAYLSELKASTPSARPHVGDEPYDADISLDPNDISTSFIEVDNVADEDTTIIPSESSIQASRQKRERLRTTALSGADDFISLSVTRYNDEREGPHPESRLVREEDELGEGDDEFAEYTSALERIALGKKSTKLEAQRRRDALKEIVADAEEEDDESMEWEREQLRRGGHFKMAAADKERTKQVYKPAPIPPATTMPTLSSAISRLTQSLSDLTTSRANVMSSLSSLAEERSQLDVREAEMREMVRKAEEKRSWFVAFKDWVESVATFLDEKFPQLEKLEDEHVSILKERSDMINRRRSTDDEDDLSVVFGSLHLSAEPETEMRDELGRSLPNANSTVSRRERQSARLMRRSRRMPNPDAEEGYSTDSSLSPSDAMDFNTAIKKLLSDKKEILSDVRAAEFKDPSRGLGKWFGEWRSRFGDTYTSAWGGLGVVAAWEFWVRLEIMGWNPVDDPRNLNSFSWYSTLQEYSRSDLEENLDPKQRPDGDLVSAMISTAMIPRLCKLIAVGMFDPYSAKGLRRVVELAKDVEASVGGENAKFQMLLKSGYTSFQQAVVETEALISRYLAHNNPRFDPDAIPARRRFLARRIKLLQNLLSWREYSGERFGVGELSVKLVEASIFPVARSGWEVGGEESLRKATSLLPSELVPESLKSQL